MDLLLYNLGHVEGRERYFSGEALQQRADAVLVLCLPLSDVELEALGSTLGRRAVLVGTDIEQCPSVPRGSTTWRGDARRCSTSSIWGTSESR